MATRRDTTAAIVDAFATLTRDGRPVTVRALRDQARVSTEAAREWLAKNRPESDAPTPPSEMLTEALAPLWSTAIRLAREETAEASNSEREALTAAEAEALKAAEQATKRAEEAEDRVAALTAELEQTRNDLTAALSRAESADDAARAARDQAAAEIAVERDRARAAEQASAAATATANTLREIVDTLHRRDKDTQ